MRSSPNPNHGRTPLSHGRFGAAWTLWALAMAGVIVAAGCGGGDESTSTGGSAGSSGGAGTGGTGGTGGGGTGGGGTGGSADAGEDAAAGMGGAVDASTDVDDAAPDAPDDVSMDVQDDTAQDAPEEDGASDAAEEADANPCGCEPGDVCINGVCLTPTSCQTDDDCIYDMKCEQGICSPWEDATFSYDPACIHVAEVGVLSPRTRCEFTAPPAGDPFPNHVDVQGTPIVATFDGMLEAPASIAAAFTATVPSSYTEDLGVIRVLSGKDCTLQQNLGGGEVTADYLVSSATLAAADLDGDAAPEIVASTSDGGLIAFTQKVTGWDVLWKAPYAAGMPGTPCNTSTHRCARGWAGPSIHDLDDDGVPEIIREGVVFGADGTVLSMPPAGYASYSQGLFPVLANLDDDAPIEFTNGAFIWEWVGGAWVVDPSFPGAQTSAPGHVAVADFGAYGSGAASDAELVVVRSSTVRIHALDGSLAMPAVTVPGNGGGAPTVADFDGDGLPEVGIAGRAYYTVYDIDCGADPRPTGQCTLSTCDNLGGVCPAGGLIAWSRSTQDLSSNVTGSSVFDFEADGRSEVVYADECFTRVYDGYSGEVVFSQYRSSCTWYENPVVADVDGNFRADLIIPSNKACSPGGTGIACQTLDANGVDPQFVGVRCDTDQDCQTGSCDAGYCRCTTTASCCGTADDAACIELGLQCSPPPAGTPGTGNTCRAPHPHGTSGIRVYSDLNDQWVRSRRIWNQHAYHVTHVDESGRVPTSSAWEPNWTVANLNNFRQNVPGTPNMSDVGDATAGVTNGAVCQGGEATLTVEVCNRGAAPVGSDIDVGFYVGGSLVCSTLTTKPLQPGTCEEISCTWSTPPTQATDAVDVDVFANDNQDMTECKTANNQGLIHDVYCP
jgi:hypothetical protein